MCFEINYLVVVPYMKNKTYILDTNVLLTDANAIFSFEKDNVILPFTVLEELDRHKDRQDEVGKNARETARKLGNLIKNNRSGNLIEGISLGEGRGLIKILSTEEALGKNSDIEIPTELQEFNTGDNRIVKFCLSYAASHSERESIILVTRDVLLQIKGFALGIEIQDYKKFNITDKSETLYNGCKVLEGVNVDEFYENRFELSEEQMADLNPNQFVILKNENASAMARYIVTDGSATLKKVENKQLGKFKPKNKEQTFAIDLLMDPSVKLVTLIGKAGSGKAGSLDSRLLTPSGWTTMGKIKVGDYVIGSNGKPTKVTGVFPQGDKEIFKVIFSDGSSTECCKEHLWNTKTEKERSLNSEYSTKSLEEIMETVKLPNRHRRNHSIPMVAPVEFHRKKVAIEPYSLGLLLGDGGMSTENSVSYSTADFELVEHLNNNLPENCILKQKSKYDWYIVRKDIKKTRFNPLNKELKKMELIGRTSHEKFIPEIYKYNSFDTRLAVFQGLMDTDGYVSGHKCIFYSTSEQLVKDMQELVWSFGGKATIKNKKTNYKGTKRNSFTLDISLPSNIKPCRLKRKLEKYIPRTKYQPTRYVDKIEYVGIKPAQCIRVESPDSLYITDDYIVTHNTLCALAAGLEQVIGDGSKGAKKHYTSLLVTRPIQPMGKDIGYLPGTLEEKMEPWIAPIKDNLRFLITEGKKGVHNEQILNQYFENGIIEVEAMTFIRGRSIANAIIIVDEAQNLSVHELKTILTRVGENTKIILTGDIEQIDNMYLDSVSNGLSVAIEKFKSHPIAGHVTLIKGERSELATAAANCL